MTTLSEDGWRRDLHLLIVQFEKIKVLRNLLEHAFTHVKTLQNGGRNKSSELI
jgi:hypothetical protein